MLLLLVLGLLLLLLSLTLLCRYSAAYAGLKVQEGSGRVHYQWLLSPLPHPSTKKILTRFLRFAWTPLGSSGGSGPLDPTGQLRRCRYSV